MNWIKKHKKTTIIFIVILLAVGYTIFKPKPKVVENNILQTRTVTLEKQDLNKSITVSGNVQSTEVSSVSTTISGAKFTRVNVSVGDQVNEGDIIATLDTETINKQIEKEKENIQDQIEAAQEAYDNAVLAKDRGWGTFDQARTNKENACNSSTINNLQNQVNSANAKLTQLQNAVNEAQEAYNKALNEYNTCLVSPTTTPNNMVEETPTSSSEPTSTPCSESYEKYDDAQEALQKAQLELQNAQASTGYTNYLAQLQQAQSACDAATSSFNQIDIQQQGLEAQVTSTLEKLNELKSGTSDTLENLYDQLEDYTIKATASGKVTSLNATVGAVASGTIATIQNLDELKVICNVQEYDIQSIELGMKAIITSDANDQQFSGTVTSISATSSSSSTESGVNSMGGNSSSSVTFPVEITLDGQADLLIGMNANVEIITESETNTYVVPLDAIETLPDGTTNVYVQQQDGTFNAVKVETGLSNDYYVAIKSSDLSDGLQVKASAIDAQIDAQASYDQLSDMTTPIMEGQTGLQENRSQGAPVGGPSGQGGRQ